MRFCPFVEISRQQFVYISFGMIYFAIKIEWIIVFPLNLIDLFNTGQSGRNIPKNDERARLENMVKSRVV